MKIYRFVVLCDKFTEEGGHTVRFYDSINNVPIAFNSVSKNNLLLSKPLLELKQSIISNNGRIDPYDMKHGCESLPLCTYTEKDIEEQCVAGVIGFCFEEIDSEELNNFVLIDTTHLSASVIDYDEDRSDDEEDDD